jgi:hypothetical protein
MKVPVVLSALAHRRGHVIGASSAVVLLAVGGLAATAQAARSAADVTYYACTRDNQVQSGSIQIGVAPNCPNGATVTQWNAQGPQGVAGPAGPAGSAGPAGPAGDLTSAFGVNTQRAGSGAGNSAFCYLGQIMLTAGDVAIGTPARGQLLSIDDDNQALFALLGKTYGGDGVTTFALPDLTKAAPNGTTYGICTQGAIPSRD